MHSRTTPRPARQHIKTARLRIRALRDELTTCTTDAMRRCVQESLDAARAELTRLEMAVALPARRSPRKGDQTAAAWFYGRGFGGAS